MNSPVASPPVKVYQLNRNSCTVSGSPVRSWQIWSVSKEFHSCCSVDVNSSKVASSLDKSL
jgi:hypothetical protein